ncbi:MAG: HD domain-containing protein [Desulfobacterales bacterium]|nr:HD domain-containing protein [Desulfobacterales bacterium]
MKKSELIDLKSWFADYVSNYYTTDPAYNRAISLKEEHTKRVCDNIVMLCKALDISAQEMLLAETMALLHDIGRFKQYAVYGTFKDMDSKNHAILGLQQIGMHKILCAFSKYEKRLITKAVAYHNVAVLPNVEDKKILFFMRLLRDADKLDIWKVVIDYYHERKTNPSSTIELGLPDEHTCSPKILQALMEHRLARIEDLKTLNDFKLLQIGWVFDLNFTPSFQTVQNRKYLEQLASTLPQSKEVKEAVKRAHDHVIKCSGKL